MKNKKILIGSLSTFVLGLIICMVFIILQKKQTGNELIGYIGLALTLIGLTVTLFFINKLGRKIGTMLIALLMLGINIVIFLFTIKLIKEDLIIGFKGSDLGLQLLAPIFYLIVFLPAFVVSVINMVINFIKKEAKGLPNILLMIMILFYISQFVYFFLTVNE